MSTEQTPEPTADLPGGLVLRTACPADLDQIGELLERRGEPGDACDQRLVALDPDEGWRSTAVVVDGDRVVSTATLLDETLRLGDVVLPAGQVELVATDAAYEGRGLVRALMGWAHAESARRGHLVQEMVGIPYFYRLFGYEYAIGQPRARRLTGVPAGGRGDVVRPATAADIPALAALQEVAQAGFDLAVPHPAARWRWLVAHEATRTLVVERDGRVVGSGRISPGSGLVAEATAQDADAVADLLGAVARQSESGRVGVVERLGTCVHTVCEPLMEAAGNRAEQYYVRIPDDAAVLDALRPVLSARLAAAGLEREEVLLSTYRRHYRFPVGPDGLGTAVVGGPLQDPVDNGGAGVAPDWLPALLFGPWGIEGLERLRPDVTAAGDEELFGALFPPVTADVLSYYLPF
ncbi:GNAT family N-acetyltransferase [Actinotalea fermentans]|uniref:N-acetyltransferase domain-containing protein n=1 Tax=Actinotalea fermentans TaxID=43671 RepID=A0A511YX09_9CELL|nr:GNAT family N-acetyltransferase [Actinotalea fermentans]GEN79743.1 hypothetical protein AFE02nite_14770 [Actinotalea fermentans]